MPPICDTLNMMIVRFKLSIRIPPSLWMQQHGIPLESYLQECLQID